MESSHSGELGLGSGRSRSSRKGKKSSTDKPKQPQRGLGIAQLERIRLHDQMASHLPSLHHPPYHASLNKVQLLIEFLCVMIDSIVFIAFKISFFVIYVNFMRIKEFNGRFLSILAGGWKNRNGFFVIVFLFFLVSCYLIFTLSSPSQYYGKSKLKLEL